MDDSGTFASEEITKDEDTYEAVTCIMCRQVHLVNRFTGKVLGRRVDHPSLTLADRRIASRFFIAHGSSHHRHRSNRPRSSALAGLWIDEMSLCARKARYLHVSEVIVRIVSRPSRHVVACSGTGTAAYNLNRCYWHSYRNQREPAQCFHVMNERTQACLRKADDCEHATLQTTDESARLLYLDLANAWRTLAEQVETIDRQRARFEQSEPKPEGT